MAAQRRATNTVTKTTTETTPETTPETTQQPNPQASDTPAGTDAKTDTGTETTEQPTTQVGTNGQVTAAPSTDFDPDEYLILGFSRAPKVYKDRLSFLEGKTVLALGADTDKKQVTLWHKEVNEGKPTNYNAPSAVVDKVYRTLERMMKGNPGKKVAYPVLVKRGANGMVLSEPPKAEPTKPATEGAQAGEEINQPPPSGSDPQVSPEQPETKTSPSAQTPEQQPAQQSAA